MFVDLVSGTFLELSKLVASLLSIWILVASTRDSWLVLKTPYHCCGRIHEILVWIRIRGSMPLTNRSGSGSCYIRH